MFQLAAGGSLEQPQTAGIPEKELHFSFPPRSGLGHLASLPFLSQMWLGVVEMPEQHLGIVLGLALLGFGRGR